MKGRKLARLQVEGVVACLLPRSPVDQFERGLRLREHQARTFARLGARRDGRAAPGAGAIRGQEAEERASVEIRQQHGGSAIVGSGVWAIASGLVRPKLLEGQRLTGRTDAGNLVVEPARGGALHNRAAGQRESSQEDKKAAGDPSPEMPAAPPP